MGRLTTHVLDTALGRPAVGLAVELWRLGEGDRTLVSSGTTNADGRLDAPMLAGPDFVPGTYEIVFRAGDYLRASGAALTDPPFLDVVPVRFGLAEDAHYHVPLLLSAHGYSTYRGS